MQLIYQGTDISRAVNIVRCVHHDVSGERCDCLEIELDDAASWFRWQPQMDDTIRVIHNGCDTGILYLGTILPEAGKYRILATAVPSTARRRTYRSYENMRLEDIVSSCAAECGMKSALHGISGELTYPYLLREDESAPAFLNRILRLEGAALKAYDGQLLAIGIEHAQSIDAGQTISVSTRQEGVRYQRRNSVKLSGITVATPFAEGTAVDHDAASLPHETHTDPPACDNAQAQRWAQGLLLHNNRAAEELHIHMEFNPGLTSMGRVDISSTTDADGMWLIDEVTHDFINKTSSARLLRCVTTIG